MMKIKNVFALGPLVLILAASFALIPQTGAQQSAPSAYGDMIIIGSINEPDTLVPILAHNSVSRDIGGLLFNGLVKFDNSMNIIPDLAENWKISDDGLVITFNLRQDVHWHDGKQFTADDVRFTYEKLADPDIPTDYSIAFQKIKELKTPDKFTIEVVYDEPFSPGVACWSVWIMPRHILEGQDIHTDGFSKNPVGTGPYKLKSWKPGERIDLEYNPDYFDGRPGINRVIYKIVPDRSAMLAGLKSQAIDLMQLTILQYKDETNDDIFTSKNRLIIRHRYPSSRYTFIAYNWQDVRFKDRRVRLAINSAVDRNEIIRSVLFGGGRICTSPFSPDSWACDKELVPVQYDKKWSKELLANAGWLDTDKDGWVDKRGRPFEFSVLVSAGNTQHQAVAQIIQKRLAEVGIKLEIKIVGEDVLLDKVLDDKDFEAVMLEREFAKDPDSYGKGLDFITYKDETINALMEKARRTFDRESRASYYREVHRVLHKEQPRLFLYTPDLFTAIHKRFRGPKPGQNGVLCNFSSWWVPENEQKYLKYTSE